MLDEHFRKRLLDDRKKCVYLLDSREAFPDGLPKRASMRGSKRHTRAELHTTNHFHYGRAFEFYVRAHTRLFGSCTGRRPVGIISPIESIISGYIKWNQLIYLVGNVLPRLSGQVLIMF